MKKRIAYIVFLLLSCSAIAQIKTIGIPGIKSYPKSEYLAGTQNWGISQDQKGFIYFANNDGLLRFDGQNWDLHRISDSSPLRSVHVDNKNRIFVGMIHDFGVLVKEDNKIAEFKSLLPLLPEDLEDFDDIWRIHEIDQKIIFQCYKYLFIYHDEKIEVLKPEKEFHFSFQLGNRLFVHEKDIGIFELRDGKLERLSAYKNDLDISAILELENEELIVCSNQSGIFRIEGEELRFWDTEASKAALQHNIYCAHKISDDYFALGTIQNGLIIADTDGNILEQINTSNGLLNNTILSMYVDSDKNLWLGLDNGINYVEINSPLSYIGNAEDIGTGYCCEVFEGNLYLGTNQGLFVRPFEPKYNNTAFTLVENTDGQVWSLGIFEGELICGHHEGTFKVNGTTATRISSVEGAWKYIPLSNHPNLLLGGHYSGLLLLKQGTRGWEFFKQIEGFSESSRYLHEDQEGQIWMSHSGKGVYRILLDSSKSTVSDYQLFTENDGLPAHTNNILIPMDGKPYFSTVSGIYEFDSESDKFSSSNKIFSLFNTRNRLKKVEKDQSGNIWYIASNEIGVLRKNEDQTYTKITSPFTDLLDNFVVEFEFIYPFDDENVFIGLDNGFAHYTSRYSKQYIKDYSAFVTKMEILHEDTTLYFNETSEVVEVDIPFRNNSFRLFYTAPFYENNTPMEFSYYFEGFSDDWSTWATDRYRDFTTLKEGTYTFSVKARNSYGVESSVSSVTFTISPPWHRSLLAYILYGILFVMLIVAVSLYVIIRFKRAKRKEQLRHESDLQKKEEAFQRQSIIAEKEIIKLRNEKLRAEMIHRDKELANQTMNIIQKNKFIANLNDELQRIQNQASNDQVKTRISQLKKKIKREIDNKQQNQLFETYFNEVHEDFFTRLKEKYPNLTPNDLRLCAYIRMNMSTKEIASLLNISYRGTEISRYRLRKKLELSREVNLSTFLLNI